VGIISGSSLPIAAHGPGPAVLRFRQAMAPGSHLWVTALSLDGVSTYEREMARRNDARLGYGLFYRSAEQCRALLDDLEPVPPV
jgi:hypothetical protein